MGDDVVNCVRDGRVVCPICTNKTGYAVLPETSANNLKIFCKKCKCESIVTIIPKSVLDSQKGVSEAS